MLKATPDGQVPIRGINRTSSNGTECPVTTYRHLESEFVYRRVWTILLGVRGRKMKLIDYEKYAKKWSPKSVVVLLVVD
jgi:hypothetical protein